MRTIIYLLIVQINLFSFSQTLPTQRSVDWKLAGLRDTSTAGFITIDMQTLGVINDGLTPNDALMDSLLNVYGDQGTILSFPAGDFLFQETIELPNNTIIRGDGAESTTFHFDLGGSDHSFHIEGENDNTSTSSVIGDAWKDNDFILVDDPSLFSSGDWIRILLNDSSLVTSSWAHKTVGQIVRVLAIENNKLLLESPLRMDYDSAKMPYVVRMLPAKNIGIECLKIHRIDNTSPSQTSNVYYSYAVNCWVKGVESENCTFSHVQARRSSNIYIANSYFHHGFEYGGNGRAYGVMLHITSNECLVENSLFEHLRHSIIVQAGANGNVFAYNYSLDPYWDSSPSNSAGDLVLHGNYAYANLFEQNIGQNIVIDNSHGPNGPFNTFFRNRSEGYGIFFSASNSPDQNFLGNEITNSSFPYSLVNYTILGSGHFLHGNNDKGTIHPLGTELLPDVSYAYDQIPDFISNSEWAGIGTPNITESTSIPAFERFHNETLFTHDCSTSHVGEEALDEDGSISVYPNPADDYFSVKGISGQFSVCVYNSLGALVFQHDQFTQQDRVDLSSLPTGLLLVKIESNETVLFEQVMHL